MYRKGQDRPVLCGISTGNGASKQVDRQEDKGNRTMLNLEVKTKMKPDTVLERFKAYFGEAGLGLTLTSEGPQCVSFEGGGGYVTATLCPEDAVTRINLETREWDYHAKQFAAKLH